MKRFAVPVLAGTLLMAASPSARLDALLKEHWEYSLRTSPEFATALGDPRYNDRLSDVSLGAIGRDEAWKRAFLKRLQAVPDQGLDAAQRLNKELLVARVKDQLEGAAFRPWELPLNQMDGLHLDFPQLFANHPFRTAKDYRDYVARLRAFGQAMDATIAHMRRGMAARRMPPRLVTEQILGQVRPLSEGETARGPFLEPLKKLPEAIPQVEREAIRRAAEAAVTEVVTPAYRRLRTFLEAGYAKGGREQPGLSALEGGDRWYAHLARHHTTTGLSPKEIHAIGQREVARIESEMTAIGQRLGFADLAAFRKHLAEKQDLRPKDGADLVARYQGFVDGMRSEIPKLFGRLPKAPLVVVPMEAFRAEGAAAADYNGGTPDGSRPGRFSVNTFKAEERTTLTIESTAYHEALPGHHLQVSIAQELEGLPPFRKYFGYTAFEEGWALYSERLPKELGYYKDPYSDYGRLNDEMLRAIRLVLDTGVHHLGWSRQQMVDYFRAHGSMDEVDIQSETDRYIAWPGQALAYKVGQLKILELRDRAKAKLGDRFDLRAFHDLVLGGGPLPMGILERRVEAWISSR